MSAYALEIPPLQNRLPLFRFFCKQLGADNGFKPLRDLLKDSQQGYADDGHSHFYHIIVNQSGVKLPAEKLSEYDLRIKRYLERLNQGRTPPVQLLYFQWLAVLFSEWFLDRYFTDTEALRKELNAYLTASLVAPGVAFKKDDLTKVAFWMATGSGKTIVMHFNMWQAQYYAEKVGQKFDSVILVTPNEGLSRQHLSELTKSGIPARHYGESAAGLLATGELVVTIIEITKLTENKRGGGLSVDVEAFGSTNLLFVDEGHRGASGEVWRALRERLAKTGFTFEYSATFGQIVNGATPDDKRKDLLDEYSHAIIFDYSYPHFYEDGYGKDYWVVNLQDDTETFNDWMMLANLLAFFEQALVYEEHGDGFRSYAIESPLWVFVGHSVTGGKTREDQASLTDVEEIVAFFDKFLRKRTEWTKRIKKLLVGDTGLLNPLREDIFQGRFEYLRRKGWDAERIFDRIVRQVFRGRVGETLRATTLKVAEGEIGLRIGSDSPYFGVINIGDVAGLISLLEDGGIACEDDKVHSASLFDEINATQSPVNILIGARKFMEGWDSFRVSSMGLMNIGRGEGSQIIQLFGRGVRLHGKANTLKRSSAMAGDAAPKHISLLETLNIFGVRANYMQRFREELRKEGIETDFEIVPVPILIETNFMKRGLQMLRLPNGEEFDRSECLVSEVRDSVHIVLDLRPQMEIADSTRNILLAERAGGENRASELRDVAKLFDWERIYFDLLEFKHAAELNNLTFTPAALQTIIEKGKYELYCADAQIRPNGFRGIRRSEEVACTVLRKYLARLYAHENRNWEQLHLRLVDLDTDDPNLNFKRYEVSTTKKDFAKTIRKLVKEADALYKKDVGELPTVHFAHHLYQPLLVEDLRKRHNSTPPLLNEGETRLVKDLRHFLQGNPSATEKRELFVLRNQSRGHGIGFFSPKDGDAFYPDFIFWLIEDERQTIAFIDPHGIGRSGGIKDPKIQLHRRLKDIEPGLQAHCPKWKVRLTSFVVSPTPYDKLKAHASCWVYSHTKTELEKEHLLFQEDGSEYIKTIWQHLLTD